MSRGRFNYMLVPIGFPAQSSIYTSTQILYCTCLYRRVHVIDEHRPPPPPEPKILYFFFEMLLPMATNKDQIPRRIIILPSPLSSF